jgi:hypothetical protein
MSQLDWAKGWDWTYCEHIRKSCYHSSVQGLRLSLTEVSETVFSIQNFSDCARLCLKIHFQNLLYGITFPIYFIWFDIGKSVHHHTIQINQPTRCNSFTSLLLDVYVWLNMFLVPPRPSSGACNCISSLWFYCWSVVVAALLVIICCYHHAPAVRLLMQLQAPDDRRGGAQNMLSHT